MRGSVLRARFASLSSPDEAPELSYLARSGGGQWSASGAGMLNA